MLKHCLLPILLALSIAPGCAAVAVGAVGGIVISNEMADASTFVVHLDTDVKMAWPIAKTTLSDTSLELIEVDDAIRVAKANINNATVTVSVEPYDIDKTILKVSARKFGFPNGETAQLVTDRIVRRLQQ